MTTDVKDTVEVDLHGEKIALPADAAKRLIAKRDADKAAMREAMERVGKVEAERQAAEAARLKAEQDAKALEHAKKGEIDQVRELMTKQHREAHDKLAAHLRDKALRAAVAATPKVVPTAVDDIVDQLKPRSRYEPSADAVVVVGSDGAPILDTSGKPMAVDAYIGEWLGKRPHYLLSDVKPGTGAQGGATGGSGRIITADELAQMTGREAAAAFAAGAKMAG